jgi:hypothetical protein
MQHIDPEYLNSELKVQPGDRLYRLVAMLLDTYYEYLTNTPIEEIEEHVSRFRCMDSSGRRVDNLPQEEPGEEI